jgi:charged multivesicular body protein 4
MFMKESLKAELEELEQDQLNERLSGADHVPIHLPAGARVEGVCFIPQHRSSLPDILPCPATETRQPVAVEDDEDVQLKELQAALAM